MKKRIWLGLSATVLVIALAGCPGTETYPTLDGTWVRLIEMPGFGTGTPDEASINFNNGNWQSYINNEPEMRGTFTANNSILTQTVTEIHRNAADITLDFLFGTLYFVIEDAIDFPESAGFEIPPDLDLISLQEYLSNFSIPDGWHTESDLRNEVEKQLPADLILFYNIAFEEAGETFDNTLDEILAEAFAPITRTYVLDGNTLTLTFPGGRPDEYTRR